MKDIAPGPPPPATSATTSLSDRLVSLHELRILIALLRLAEHDFLRDYESWTARSILFGSASPMPSVCKLLGIDWRAALLTILAWRVLRKSGTDPVFSYLERVDNYDRYVSGESLPFPSLARIKQLLERAGVKAPCHQTRCNSANADVGLNLKQK